MRLIMWGLTMRFMTCSFLWLLVACVYPNPASGAPVPGDQLPVMSLTSAAGGTRPVWSKGRITIVTFCAFWCDTWKEQSRRMTAARQALQGLPVTWTMVSVDGRWADKSREKGWGSVARGALLDTGGHWTNQLAIRSVPTTLVVDERGQVRFAEQGIGRSQTLLRVVRTLMAGQRAAPLPVRIVFDDFPSRDQHLDDHLLDTLRAAAVRAVFCGNTQRRNFSPAIVRRALRDGHVLRDAFGTPKRDVIDPFDWKRPGRDELCRRVLCAAAPGKTVLLHAGVRDTTEALFYILQALRKRGLHLEPIQIGS